MPIPNQQLFLERFLAYNKDRYKENPSFVDQLDQLVLNDIVFSNPRKETLPSGEVKHITDMAAEEVFFARNQRYTPADYVIHGVAIMVKDDSLSPEDLPKENIAGIYWLLSGQDGERTGAVLVLRNKKTVENVIAQIQESCKFELDEAEITVSADLTTATIDSPTIIGTLTVMESLGDLANAVFDGTYIFDGTLTF